MKTKNKRHDLPKTIFVTLEEAGTDNEYLSAQWDKSEVDLKPELKKRVGIYQLHECVIFENVLKVTPEK